MAFREIGSGYKSIQEFCKLMDIPPPMDSKSYCKSFTKLYRAYTAAPYDSITDTAKEVLGTPNETEPTLTELGNEEDIHH